MDNEKLTLEKFRLMGQYGCVRITPYMEFKDGTKGSVLLLRYNADDSFVVLINSPERTDEYKHGKNNTLFPSELDQLYAYREFCKEKYDGHYCMSKERYDEFGIVVLTDVFLSAVIADFICDNLNRQNQDPRHITNWNTSRTSNMLSQALHGCTIYELEDEIAVFLSEDSDWQRAILLETMALFHADQVLVKNLHIDWNIVRNKYAEWLGQNNIAVKLYFAKQVLAAYHQSEQPINWRRLLEDALRDQREYKMEFRYSDYGIQEIFGLYALSKYLYTEKPTDFAIHYAHLEQRERVSIFNHYRAACADEMLEELNAEDDPFRTELPTKEEAEEKSKNRIASLVGRQPEGLTDEQKEEYKKYELAFCRKLQVEVKEEEEPKDHLPHLGTQNNQGCTVNNFFVAPPTTEPEQKESTGEPQAAPIAPEAEELTDGTQDQHKQAFREAMLKVQKIPYEQEKYKSAIANKFDWYAALRLGKDIGLLRSFDDLKTLMEKGKFEHKPEYPQNFSKYSHHINREPLYPDWSFPHKSSEPFFHKFKFIADHLYRLYEAKCKSLKIRPRGSR